MNPVQTTVENVELAREVHELLMAAAGLVHAAASVVRDQGADPTTVDVHVGMGEMTTLNLERIALNLEAGTGIPGIDPEENFQFYTPRRTFPSDRTHPSDGTFPAA